MDKSGTKQVQNHLTIFTIKLRNKKTEVALKKAHTINKTPKKLKPILQISNKKNHLCHQK